MNMGALMNLTAAASDANISLPVVFPAESRALAAMKTAAYVGNGSVKTFLLNANSRRGNRRKQRRYNDGGVHRGGVASLAEVAKGVSGDR